MDSTLHSRAPYALQSIVSIAALQYYCLAAIVILYYDFVLTFHQEIQRIWKQKISIVSCIFVLNRYLTCLGYIPIVYFLFNSPTSDKACTAFARFPGALSTITQSFVVVILIMRVYALYRAKRWILWLTVPLGTFSIAVAAWGLTRVLTTDISFGPQTLFKACVPSFLKSKLAFKLSWFINGTFDSLIFFLTVFKTCHLSMEHRHVGMRSGLTRLFIRDGGMFFGLLAAANLVNVVFFLKVKASVFEESAGNNSVLTHTLSSTLLSRLILNLREAGSKLDTTGTQLSTRFSLAPGDDIMLVSSSTFSNRHNSNSVTTRSSDYPWTTIPSLSMAGSTAVGSIGTVVEHELEAPTMLSQLDSLSHI